MKHKFFCEGCGKTSDICTCLKTERINNIIFSIIGIVFILFIILLFYKIF